VGADIVDSNNRSVKTENGGAKVGHGGGEMSLLRAA
jgi:hypothetical protein